MQTKLLVSAQAIRKQFMSLRGAHPPHAVAVALLMATVALTSGCQVVKNLTDPATVPQRSIQLEASPMSLPEGGGEVQLTATVTLDGQPESGVRVTFEASGGTFDPANTAVTDNAGKARTKLSVTGPVTVTAKVEAGSVSVASSESLQIRTDTSPTDPGQMVFDVSWSPKPVPIDQPVSFEIQVTHESDGTSVEGKLEVEFGDGKTATNNAFNGNVRVQHTYKEASIFNAVVKVTDANGNVGSSTYEVEVVDDSRVLVELTADQAAVAAKESLGFTVRLVRENGKEGSGKVKIDWGDGRQSNLGEITGEMATEHTFRDKGSYKVVAEVTDANGNRSTASVRIRVNAALTLSATLTASNSSPQVNVSVRFTLSASRSDGARLDGTASIDFGDGSSARSAVTAGTANFEHTYSSRGTYSVSADVDDGAGHTASASMRIDVVDGGGGGGGGGGQDELDPNSIVWLHANVAGWSITSTTTSVSVTPQQICIEHTKAGQWPVASSVEGNPWVVANIGGTWYAGTYEWLRSGQTCKSLGVPSSNPDTAHALGPHIKQAPLSTWVPKKGEVVYFFVSTLARTGLRTVNERSNIVKVVWPY